MLDDLEAEEKNFCNQKQRIHAQSSAYESDNNYVKTEYDDELKNPEHYDENGRLIVQVDTKRRQSLFNEGMESQSVSEQRKIVLNDRMNARDDMEQHKRLQKLKSQIENKQRPRKDTTH
jgi:hypothetical protein